MSEQAVSIGMMPLLPHELEPFILSSPEGRFLTSAFLVRRNFFLASSFPDAALTHSPMVLGQGLNMRLHLALRSPVEKLGLYERGNQCKVELNAGSFRWPFFFLLAMPGKNGRAT